MAENGGTSLSKKIFHGKFSKKKKKKKRKNIKNKGNCIVYRAPFVLPATNAFKNEKKSS